MTRAVDAAARFNAGAGAYATLWAPVLLPYGQRLLGELDLSRSRRVLEIAAGVGSLLPSIRDAAPAARVVAVDIAASMIALAPRTFDRAVMDAAHLAFAAGTFDAALMPFALFFMPDPEAALGEAHRVLARNGRFALTSWKGEPHFRALDVWIEEVLAAGLGPISPWCSDAIAPDRLTDTLQRTGFSEIRTFLARFDHQHHPDRFLELRLALAEPRLASLSADTRRDFLLRVRARLAALQPDDYLDPTEIMFAAARV